MFSVFANATVLIIVCEFYKNLGLAGAGEASADVPEGEEEKSKNGDAAAEGLFIERYCHLYVNLMV